MSKVKNNQFVLNLRTLLVDKLLKFFCFFVFLLLLSCGNEKTKNTPKETQPTEQNITTEMKTKTILCFGDSITAGFGLDDNNDAFPGVLQQRIDSLNLNYTVINSGLSGETTAGGKSRINWILKQAIEIFILELGANDGLRGVSLSETRANLQAIITTVKQKSPKTTIILAGMELPPNMGQDYTTEFKQIYADLAEQNTLKFIPFILKNVGGVTALNQDDGIHPTVEGHKIVANTVWKVLQPMLSN